MSYLIAPRPAFWLSWNLSLTPAGESCKLDLWWLTRWSSVMLSRNCSWLEKNFWYVNNMLILPSGHWSQTPSAWWPIYEKLASSLQIDLEVSDHAINNSFLGCFLFSKICHYLWVMTIAFLSFGIYSLNFSPSFPDLLRCLESPETHADIVPIWP